MDNDEEVEAPQSLPPQEDSRLDSVSVEPVEPIDIVLPICIPIAFIGFVSIKVFWNKLNNYCLYINDTVRGSLR